MELIKQIVIIRVSNDKLQETFKILDLIQNENISSNDVRNIRLFVEGYISKKNKDINKGEVYDKDTD